MKSELDQLADRHLRVDPQGVLADVEAMKSGIVLVHVSSVMAGALGVQHLVWMLVSLLSRQFKVVTEIILDVPEAALHKGVAPFGAKSTLIDTLKECVRQISGPYIKVRGPEVGLVPDVALVIGDGAPVAAWHWKLYADGWRYFIGIDGKVPTTPPQSGLSIGPYLCASYAAGEVFKLMRGMKPGKGEFIRTHFASTWTMSCSETWTGLIDGPGAEQYGRLPHFYFAGAGAVTQATALCLGSSAFTGSCTAVDKDDLDLTNDNRYALSTRHDDGVSKVDILQMYLQSQGFVCQTAKVWWEDFSASGGRYALDDTTKSFERAYKFPLVLSCVDKNIPRHALQNAVPRLIFGGSTDGLSAKASIFDLGAGTACLKCHNPVKSRNSIIQERVAALQQLGGELRFSYARELGLNELDVGLLLSPNICGKLSEADLDRFSLGAPSMSVGFVSMAAGVLLAAQFLRYLRLGPAETILGGAMAVLTFSRAKIRLMSVGPDHGCNCTPLLRNRWTEYWSKSYSTY